MKRLLIITYTGATANNLKIAARLARKILGVLRKGECVLLDFEDVEPSQQFLDVLLQHVQHQPEKIKFCGLPIMRQVAMALQMQESNPRP